MRLELIAAGLLTCTLALHAHAAAELEILPDPAVVNESVQLNFRVTGNTDARPDFTPLEQDFDILGRSQQSQLSWVNGKSERSTTWTLNAMPRHSGTIAVPAIQFGAHTSPARTLIVRAKDTGPAPTGDGADIELEVTATPDAPYVQQQVIYTIRLYHRVELSNPRFSSLLTSTDSIVKPVGKGRQFTAQRHGRSYDVYEITYAIFPQQSGVLTIKPLVLTTEIADRQGLFFNPFAQALTTRRVESRAVEVNVRAVPPTFPTGATWLPAKRLRLYDEWDPDVASVAAGTPLTRTLFLWVDGLIAGQLPGLETRASSAVKLYPDQAQTSEQEGADGYTAVVQQKTALIASSAGTAEFAAIEIPWWNTATDQLEIATLPTRMLSVTGAAAPAAVPLAAAVPTAIASSSSAAPGGEQRWQWLAASCAIGWLATAWAWWRARHRVPAVAPAAASAAGVDRARFPHANHDLKSACASGDMRQARDALLAWGATRLASAPPSTLAALAANCGAELGAEVGALERALYGRAHEPWRGARLWEAFQREPAQAAQLERRRASALPELFRFAGR